MNKDNFKTEKIFNIISKFNTEGEFGYCDLFGNGHINTTYVVHFKRSSKPDKRYILQKINLTVFKNPVELMENISMVTEFIKSKIIKNFGDPSREVLNIVKTKNNSTYYKDINGDYYRVYDFIENSICYQVATKELFKASANAFGNFQFLLSDFNSTKLHQTIEDFHNTQKYLIKLKKAVKSDHLNRLKNINRELDFIMQREEELSYITDGLNNNNIPIRVTHNDTKLNNVLFDKHSNKALCVIDLDTIMPGSILYDFGDSIRFGANNSIEDEFDLSKVFLRDDLFRSFAFEFLRCIKSYLTEFEIYSLPIGAKLMTIECGIRFLTDYLEGDIYFKTNYDNHNLIRARNQFKLANDMENKIDKLRKIVLSY